MPPTPHNTPPTSVRTSGPLPEGQALWLMLLVAGLAVTASGGAIALRRRA